MTGERQSSTEGIGVQAAPPSKTMVRGPRRRWISVLTPCLLALFMAGSVDLSWAGPPRKPAKRAAPKKPPSKRAAKATKRKAPKATKKAAPKSGKSSATGSGKASRSTTRERQSAGARQRIPSSSRSTSSRRVATRGKPSEKRRAEIKERLARLEQSASKAASKTARSRKPVLRFDKKGLRGQMQKRGWTESDVRQAREKPVRVVLTTDARRTEGGRRNYVGPAMAYYSAKGGYVVVNPRTGQVIQVSDRNDPAWKAPWDRPRTTRYRHTLEHFGKPPSR